MSSSDDSSGQGQLSSTVLIAVRMVQTSIGLAGALSYTVSTCFIAADTTALNSWLIRGSRRCVSFPSKQRLHFRILETKADLKRCIHHSFVRYSDEIERTCKYCWN